MILSSYGQQEDEAFAWDVLDSTVIPLQYVFPFHCFSKQPYLLCPLHCHPGPKEVEQDTTHFWRRMIFPSCPQLHHHWSVLSSVLMISCNNTTQLHTLLLYPLSTGDFIQESSAPLHLPRLTYSLMQVCILYPNFPTTVSSIPVAVKRGG